MIKYQQTKSLVISLLDQGAIDKPAVLLLHGWPDDATTWTEIMPILENSGFRVIAPWLRGFGKTNFLNEDISKSGNAGIIAFDMIQLLDSLEIRQFFIVGHDWGANVGEAIAIGWPERVLKIAFISSPPRFGEIPVPNFKHAQLQWYHWFMATKVGAIEIRKDPISFARIMWDNWAPAGWYTEEIFRKVSESWRNPDFVDVTLHSYRSRWGEAEPDDQSRLLEEKIKSTHNLSLPALYIQGEKDGVNPPYVSENLYKKFSGYFKRIVLPGIGHFPSREAPAFLGEYLIDFFSDRSREME
ncbi:MAG: alpha/beta hydrolase [Mucilaginibacter sp.]|nr:alpha/beta hydrolase [Mucilaginibacter sp.]